MKLSDRRSVGRTDLEVTLLGFGGAPLGNLFAPIEDGDAQSALLAAWDVGCRYFDTAPLYGYGLSERRFGEALRRFPRDTYVLSTKVGRLLRPYRVPPTDDTKFVNAAPFEPVYDYSRDGAVRSIEQSLQRLGTHRLDIVLIHDVDVYTHGAERQPDMFKTAMEGCYPALAELKSAGVIGAIGLGVNEWQVCAAALDHGDFDCFLLAGRYTLLEQDSLQTLLPRCVERGTSIVLGGPFNSGILVTGPRPDAKYNYEPAAAAVAERVGRIQAICRQHDVPMAAAALQFPLAHPAVATVIPGGRTEAEVRQNAEWLSFSIPTALWSDLKSAGLMHPDAPVAG